MNTSIKIVLVNTAGLPSIVFTDGEVVVDLDSVSGLAFNKQVSELNELNKLRLNGATGASIPATKKNRIIFSKYLQLNNRCLDFEPLSVNVFVDGMPREEDWMEFIGFNDSSNTIEIELVNSKKHWLRAVEGKLLTDVNFDAFSDIELTYDNLVANWADAKWLDGNFMGWFPLINYGQKRSREIYNGETSLYKDAIFVNDFRPLITVLGTIKQMLCQEGWDFKSPVLESDWGRRLWMYVLKENYYETESFNARGRLINFRAEFNPTGPFAFLNDIYNNDSTGGNYDLGGVFQASDLVTPNIKHYWKNPLPFAHRMKFGYWTKVRNDGSLANIPKMTLSISNNGPTVYDTYQHEHDPVAPGGGIAEITGEFEIVANPGDWVQFNLSGSTATLLTFDGSYIYGRVNGRMYYNGDYVSLSDAVHPYPWLDMFKGIVHLVNGKVYTDWATKTVWLYPEENVSLHDTEDIEGFLRPNIGEVDITDIVVSKSLKQAKPIADQSRFYKLKFKDSTDPYVELKLGAKETLHAKIVDFGTKYKGEIIDENPFFEPTAEAPLFTISVDPLFYPPLDVPIMTDNVNQNDADKREISYEIGPRILYGVGLVAQQYYDPITGSPFYAELQWKFEEKIPPYTTNPLYDFPYATQLSTHNINDTDDQVNQNVVYGDRWFDMFSMFHQKQVLDTFNLPPLEFLLKMDTVYFNNEDFRKRKFLEYNGQPLMLIPDAIRDFRPDTGTPTPATFRIDRFVRSSTPCSCQFKACTFFMDIRQTITDASIAALQIRSFKVDGVEYIVSPVSLGPTVQTVVISGITYVTNLRDTINTIAAPWFTAIAAVNPAGNTQPTGKKGKYIRFEWPGCQTFEIIIESTEEGHDMYRYNQYGYWEYNPTTTLWSRVAADFPYSDFRNYNCQVVNKSESLCQ